MQGISLDWLGQLSAEELVDLVEDLALHVDGAARWLELHRLSDSVDPVALREQVDDVLTPRSGFYRYGQANAYASDGWELVQLLSEVSEEPTVELLPIIERAMTLVTRTTLRADSSSGAMGTLMDVLMKSHAKTARGLADVLTPKDRRRLADWLVKFRYGGKQDFFDPDVVAYAEALGEVGVERYRSTLDKYDLGPYGDYPLRRLAVLDRDVDAIIQTGGGEPTNAALAVRLVDALAEAELHEEARRFATRGLELPGAGHASGLADYLVQDSLDRGDIDAAVALRRDQLAAHPSHTTFASLRSTATSLGIWDQERSAAELLIREHVPWYFIGHLLHEERDAEAWEFAVTHPEAAAMANQWAELCKRRAKTHPADTLPVYRQLITSTLETTDRRNYHAAARLLGSLQKASKAAGDEDGFAAFVAAVIEENRRRPTCLQILGAAGFTA